MIPGKVCLGPLRAALRTCVPAGVVLACSVVAPTALQQELAVTTLAQGDYSRIEEVRESVVRTPEEWRALWRDHAGAAEEAPVVDFATSMVVGVFLGSRPTSGYRVEIGPIRRERARVVVEYAERRPPPGAITLQVITTPFHIVRTERYDGPVEFRRVRE